MKALSVLPFVSPILLQVFDVPENFIQMGEIRVGLIIMAEEFPFFPCLCVCVCVNVCVIVYVCVCVCIGVGVHECMSKHMCTHTPTHAHKDTHMRAQPACTCVYKHT